MEGWAGFHQPMLKKMNELNTYFALLTRNFRDCGIQQSAKHY